MTAGTTKTLVNVVGGFVIVCVALSILILTIHFVTKSAASNSLAATPNMSGSFSHQICNDAYQTETHYDKENPPYIDIRLKDGCFGGFVGLPAKWQTWQTQMLGSDPTDWVAYWAAGVTQPVGPYSATQANSKSITLSVPQGQLRLQGKGTLRFYRITGDMHSTPAPATPPERAESGLPAAPPQPQKPLHPAEPSLGASTEYSMVVEQCVRNGERIDCRGYVKNKMDEPMQLELKRGNSVDDMGNSVPFSAYNGSWAFDSGNRQKLIPSVRMNFSIKIQNPHMKAKTLALDLTTDWRGSDNELIFKDIPIEQ